MESFKDFDKKKGFSLLEVIVSIGVISFLASISIPTLRYSKEVARRTVCKNNLNQIGLLEHAYATNELKKAWHTGIPAGLIYLNEEKEEELSKIFLCPSDKENKIDFLDNYGWNADDSLHASYSGRYNSQNLSLARRLVFADHLYGLKKISTGMNHGQYGGYNGANQGSTNHGGNGLFKDNSVSWLKKED